MKTTVQREAPYRLKVVSWEAPRGSQTETLLAAQIIQCKVLCIPSLGVCTLLTVRVSASYNYS